MKHAKLPVKSQQSPLRSQFRIIAGEWRSRKLSFPDIPGLRPTPDRVRETLFNWLTDDLNNAACLDLFCGSGALGLEALSRGARSCTFVDAAPQATRAIDNHLQTLQCRQGNTITGNLPAILSRLDQAADVVFLDPPYALFVITDCLEQLASKCLLNENAKIYIECSSRQPLPDLPDNFSIHRQKIAGQVQYALLHYRQGSSLYTTDPL